MSFHRRDIVGFGDAGVWVSRAQADGSFAAPKPFFGDFGYNAGGWRVERHPRLLADTTGDGRADIVGFGYAGVWVPRTQADGGIPVGDRSRLGTSPGTRGATAPPPL